MNRLVILNADDFGYDPAVSEGIATSMRQGIVSSTTLMVNTPHSEHAASLAAGLHLGLHLNLVRFNAVSDGSELTEQRALDHAFVRSETVAQLERFARLVRSRPTHLDVHKHWHRHPVVLAALSEVARAWSLPVRSVSPAMRDSLRAAGVRTNDAFFGDTAAHEAWWTVPQLELVLDSLPATGVIELMCHPGHAPKLMQSSYGPQREDELEAFTHPHARQALERRGVKLVSWAAVTP